MNECFTKSKQYITKSWGLPKAVNLIAQIPFPKVTPVKIPKNDLLIKS